MANREPIQYVEIDVDRCSLTYAALPCRAAMKTSESRTNFLLYSEEFDNAYYTKTASSITPNLDVAPDGTTTGDRLIESATAAVHLIQRSIDFTTGLTYTLSIYAKAGSRSVIDVLLPASAFTAVTFARFDLSTGTLVTTGGTPLGTSIEDVGNGWYRCSVWKVSTATTAGNLQYRMFNVTSSYTGDGTSYLRIWGAQLETGVAASTYKKTTTVIVVANWGTGIKKCFNTYGTCQSKPNFTKVISTERFTNNQSNIPVGFAGYPVLKSVSTFSSTVNLAGSDPRLGAFGRRGTVAVKMQDFIDDDIGWDKYQQQRVSGAAQLDGIGYKPIDFGTYWSRKKVQWPHYAGRAMRVIDGFVDDGVLTITRTRHFIIVDIKQDSSGGVELNGKDVLALADDKKALAPKTSRGKVLLGAGVGIAASGTFVFDLTPAGIGVEYPASGYATIGSELVKFTRSVDTVTVTERGLKGTIAASHANNDSFQEALVLEGKRPEDFIYELLTTYAKVSTTFCPLVTKWRPELNRWMSNVTLDTVITKPTGVTQLLGELADLGLSIWWDDVLQEIGVMTNHPVFNESIYNISDENNIKGIEVQDKDEDRLTQVHFYTKQADPTKDYKDKSNYNQVNVLIDPDAETPNAYNDVKVREIFCRYLNNGADSIVRVLGLRLLKRFNTAPQHFVITLDDQDKTIGLTTILGVTSRLVTDDVGRSVTKLLQVYKKEETQAGKDFKVTAQGFEYSGRFGYCMPNTTTNRYDTATANEKLTGNFAVSATTLLFNDGTAPYVAI